MLLTQLAKEDNHIAYAFADDLALDAATIQPSTLFLLATKRFAHFSGWTST
jgi:hypothetical protein